jgi:transposase
MKQFKRHRDYGFFDQDIRLTKLSQLGDPLEKLNEGVDFEMFRIILETGFEKIAKGKGGRRPFDYVMMFKILILQRYYNLSDDQVEYQINDRMSFMRFLNLSIADVIPDCKTVWHFRQQIVDLELVDRIFSLFLKELKKLGLIVNEGKIIDASFIEVPKQRNTKDENNQIKKGETPKSFDEKPN